MSCLFAAQYTMKADLLRQTDQSVGSLDINQAGYWKDEQDPVTGEIVKRWVPITNDDPNTPEIEAFSIDCVVRSMINYQATAIRSGEQFGAEYTNVELARMKYAPNITLTIKDRVTNVRNSQGILWRDEEDEQGTPIATVFNVVAVVPVLDMFNNQVENMALLERAEVQ